MRWKIRLSVGYETGECHLGEPFELVYLFNRPDRLAEFVETVADRADGSFEHGLSGMMKHTLLSLRDAVGTEVHRGEHEFVVEDESEDDEDDDDHIEEQDDEDEDEVEDEDDE